jgi:predicted patatin/cPLA2 family phospholipase
LRSLDRIVTLNFSTRERLSTLELINARKRAESKPGLRSDRRRLALVIEGGGMRSVIAAGMLSALEELGFRDCFDVVFGSSAGAIAGAYFVAGQARYGAAIYQEVNTRRFINLWRMALVRPVVSLEFLLDDVCITRRPLDVERVLSSDLPLKVIAASLGRKSPVVLDTFIDKDDLFQALRASSQIPFFAGPPVHFRGDRFLDASLYMSIPFRAAIDDGATDIMILLSRPNGYLRREPSWINCRLVLPFLARIDPALPPLYVARAAIYRAEVDAIRRHVAGQEDPEMFVIHPPDEVRGVEAFETSGKKLAAGAEAGSRAVYAAFGMSASGAKPAKRP